MRDDKPVYLDAMIARRSIVTGPVQSHAWRYHLLRRRIHDAARLRLACVPCRQGDGRAHLPRYVRLPPTRITPTRCSGTSTLCLLDVKSGDEDTFTGHRRHPAHHRFWPATGQGRQEDLGAICARAGPDRLRKRTSKTWRRSASRLVMPSTHRRAGIPPAWPPEVARTAHPIPAGEPEGPNATTRERVTNQFKDHGSTLY